MSRGRLAVAAALGLALHAGLASGALGGLPAALRLGSAFAVLVLLPGAAFVALGARPPGGSWLAPAWALGFGIAWEAALVAATVALRVPFTVLSSAALGANALLWAAVLARRGTRAPVAVDPPLPAWAVAAVLAAAGVAVLSVAPIGTPATWLSDSPDHIGTIRRMLEHGRAFPTDAFFRHAEGLGADPRKVLWHPVVALIARLSGLDPYETWRGLSAWIAPLAVLEAAAFGVLLRGAAGAALTAWAAVLCGVGSAHWAPLRKQVLSTFLADQLATATLVAVLYDVARPRRATRLAAAGLGLAAVATHVYSAMQFTMTFGALGVAMLIRDRGLSARGRRALVTLAGVALAGLPVLLWRMAQAYAPDNVIHTAPQGLMTLWDHVRIVGPGVLWDWMGILWVLFPLAWLPLARRGAANEASLSLLSTSVVVAVVLFAPPVVGWLQPHVGYLLMRTVWMLPFAGLLAWCALELAPRIVSGSGRGRAAAAGMALGVALLVLPTARDAGWVLLHPGRIAAAERAISPVRWRAGLEWMDRNLPPGRVVLSDPITSYSVPMFTRHYVATLVDQHSSPDDSLALTRLLDARDALDPYAGWERTREVVDRYGVDVVVLNDAFRRPPLLDYWAPSHPWYVAVRRRLERAPRAFERVYDRAGFTVYRVHRAALDSLTDDATPRPYVTAYLPGRSIVVRREGAGLPAFGALSLWPRVAAPGDTVSAVAVWRAVDRCPPGSYQVAVRFDRPLPGGFEPPAVLRKPLRKLLERLHGERYRFRVDHLPVGGRYGVDRWTPSEFVRDSFRVAVPRDVADGVYVVRVKMIRQPHYPNIRLSDYFFDDDYYSGLDAGRLAVSRGRPIPPGALAPPGEGH